MPLKRGFTPGKCIADSKWRQLFLYHDNRFSKNNTIIFHVANIIMRHAVNRSVHAGIKAKPEAFAAFKKEMASPTFQGELENARTNPRSREAGKLIQRLMRFITMSGVKIPWSPEEREKEITYIIANHRYFGAASTFYTYAPDDVHAMDVIRWAYAYAGKGAFPETVPQAYIDALQGQSDKGDQRVYQDKDSGDVFDMRNKALQQLAADNPIACAAIFEHITENVRENLLCRKSKRLADKPLQDLEPGVFGVCAGNYDVKEANKRGALHNHGLFHGGITPALLSYIAEYPDLVREAMDALDTQLTASIPLEYHRLAIATHQLRIAKRRDQAYDVPEPPLLAGDKIDTSKLLEWRATFLEHTRIVVANRNVHRHEFSCECGAKGKIGCRYNMPMGHNINNTRLVQLIPKNQCHIT